MPRSTSIGWSGTSSGWLGFDADRRLVRAHPRAHRHPGDHRGAGAQRAAGAARRARLALVTPYTADVQQRIVDNYAALGIEVVAERHLGIRVNHDFALVEPRASAAR